MTQLYAFFVQLRQFAVDHILENIHQALDFFTRAAPILGGKSIDGQVFNAELNTCGYDAAKILSAGAVADQARQAASECPTSIPIHNDGDVGGNLRRGGRRLFCHNR